MQILMLCSDISKGVLDYSNHVKLYDIPGLSVVTTPKLSVFDQSSGRRVLKDLIDSHEHDVLHIQYDENIFATSRCPYEQLENLVWLIDSCVENNKRVVITLHGINQYKPHGSFTQKASIKLLQRYWRNHVIPAWKRCDIIVHNYRHKMTLYKLGCDVNVHVIHPSIEPHARISSKDESLEIVRLVVPGTRSSYKKYDHAFEMLSLLPENYHLYISDAGHVTDDVIARQSNRRDIVDRLHLVTFDSDKSMYIDQLKLYDVAVLPYSDDIPCSGSLQDCLSVMMPCLTSDTRSFVEFNNINDCIIPCKDLAVTGNLLIRRLINDTEYSDGLVDKIRQYHKENDSSRVKQRLYNVYTPPVRKPCYSKNNIINVFMCCRDNQDTLDHTLDKLTEAQQQINDTQFKYYIQENDSVDDTPDMIRKFFESNEGNHSCDVFKNVKWSSSPGVGRMRDMARYRNMMKGLCDDWEDSSYSFIVDSEIEFDIDIMSKQIKYLQQHADVVMVTPYGTVGTSDVYYDQFAYRDMNNTQDITNVKDRVRSAFAGFACIRTPVLQRCEWSCVDGDTSEHVPFCDMVRRHGDIAIDREVTVRW